MEMMMVAIFCGAIEASGERSEKRHMNDFITRNGYIYEIATRICKKDICTTLRICIFIQK